MASPQPKNKSQISDLPGVTTYITGHNAAGKAIVHETRPATWKNIGADNTMGFNVVYTSSFPADLNGDKDVKAHDAVLEGGKLGLVKKGGVVCRQVDIAPAYTCIMHRTQSLDFGIVLEGAVEMLLDDGSSTLMHRGDVAVQRATMHAWRNPSATEWTRMQFILQDVAPVLVNGERVGEDISQASDGSLEPSGNDD